MEKCRTCLKKHIEPIKKRHIPPYLVMRNFKTWRFIFSFRDLWPIYFPIGDMFFVRPWLNPEVRCMIEIFRKEFGYSKNTAPVDLYLRLERIYRYNVEKLKKGGKPR